MRALLAGLVLALPLLAQAAVCSAYQGQVFINELRIGASSSTSTSNQIELYNSGNVAQSVWSTWQLVVYYKSSTGTISKKGGYLLSSGMSAAGQFIYNSSKSIYLRNRTSRSVDVALVDASGNFIDYIAIGSAIQTVPSCLGTAKVVTASSSSDVAGDLARATDGGTWPNAITSTSTHTIGSSNVCTVGSDLSVSNGANPGKAIIDTTSVTYTLTVSNRSCSNTITGIAINVTGLSANSFKTRTGSASLGSFSITSTGVTWNFGSLAKGNSATLLINAIPAVMGTINVTAAVSAPTTGLTKTADDSASSALLVVDRTYIAFDIATDTVTEGSDASYAALISATLAPTAAVTISYTVSGTATSADTNLLASGTVVLDPTNPDSPDATAINFAIKNDSLNEPTKTIVLTLTAVTSADESVALDTANNTMTVSLLDDDSALDHYELSLAASSQSCAPSLVTVTACVDGSKPCTNKATNLGGKTALLATSAGVLGATTVTFDATGVARTALSYQSAATGAMATVSLSNEQIVASSARQCCPAGASCSTANSCTTTLTQCPASSAPTLVATARYGFEAYDTPGSYIRHANYDGWISPVDASSDATTMADATFVARPGLASASCWSFESVNLPGYYLRHQNFVLRLQAYSSAALYLADVTFCLRQGLADASAVSFEAYNYPGYYLQHDAVSGNLTAVRLATIDGSADVNGRATFVPRGGWSGGVDHYELQVPSSSLACAATPVTVKACADATSPCTNGASNLVGQTATLSTSAGAVGAKTLSFDASGGATTTLSYPGASEGDSVSLSLTNESVAATAARRCCPDGVNCSAANSCASTFHTAGFIISAAAGGTALTLPTQTAGVTSGSYNLRAVRTNTSTQACQAALTGATTVNWAYQCNNPATCSAGNLLSITGSAGATPVAGNANGSSAASTPVAMTFDANGNAPFSVNHADVGQVTLLASKPAGGSLLAPLSGNSNAFVVKPAGFTLSGIRCSSYAAGSCATAAIASPGNNPGANTAGDAAFIPAGQPFSVTVTAVNAANQATPGYGRESVPEGVKLSAALLQPAGGNAPALANPSAFGAFSGGVATGTSFAWNEVGIISLTPSVADGDYLGAGPVVGTASGPVGRFIPASFALNSASVTHRSALSCAAPSDFSYLGEVFQLSFGLTAVDTGGTVLRNYSGSFAKLAPSVASTWNLAGVAGSTPFTTANGRLSLGTATGSWANGEAKPITLNATAQRAATPDGPFAANFGIAPQDSDGVKMGSYDINVGGAGNDHANLANVALRFGRLRLANAIGDQTRPLGLPLTAQYWNSSVGAFDTNTLDSCTVLPASAVSFGKRRGTLQPADLGSTGTSVALRNGVGTLKLKAPTGGRRGTADLALSLGSTAQTQDASCLQPWTPEVLATAGAGLAHLRGAWCASTYTKDPSARASFGLYRGADNLVYMRENP